MIKRIISLFVSFVLIFGIMMSLAGCDMIRQKTDKELVESELNSLFDSIDTIENSFSSFSHFSLIGENIDIKSNDNLTGEIGSLLDSALNFGVDFFTDDNLKSNFNAKISIEDVTILVTFEDNTFSIAVPEASEDYLSVSLDDINDILSSFGINTDVINNNENTANPIEIKDPVPFRVNESDLKGSDNTIELFGENISVRTVEMPCSLYLDYIKNYMNEIISSIPNYEQLPEDIFSTNDTMIMYFEKNTFVKMIIRDNDGLDKAIVEKRNGNVSYYLYCDELFQYNFSIIDEKITGNIMFPSSDNQYWGIVINGNCTDYKASLSVSSAEFSIDGEPLEGLCYLTDIIIDTSDDNITISVLSSNENSGLFDGSASICLDNVAPEEIVFSGNPIKLNLINTLTITKWIKAVKDVFEEKAPILSKLLSIIQNPIDFSIEDSNI